MQGEFNMSDKKNQKKSNKRNDKRKMKCSTCHFYNHDDDYCMERDIENCSIQNNVNFSKCDSYLVKDKLLYF